MIRHAQISDYPVLTEIAFLAKQTWEYPSEFLWIWKDELTITSQYIKKNSVFVFEKENEIAGFISMVKNTKERRIGRILVEKGFWMDHLFVHPNFQRMGVGTQLVEFLLSYCFEKQISELLIFVDPNAVQFYEKLGAKIMRISDSSIPDRELPVYKLEVGVS